MKVKELIKFLKNKNPNMIVLGSGYEDGYDEIKNAEIKIGDKTNDSKSEDYTWYYGEYNLCDNQCNDCEKDKCEILKDEFVVLT